MLRSGHELGFGEDGTGIYLSEETLNARFSFDEISDDPVLRKLAEDSFLVPEQKDETESYLSVLSLLRIRARKKGYDGYMILPTLGCNARCFYCYEEGRQQVSMSPETLDRAIAFILATRRKNTELHLKWFGGEPLLRPDMPSSHPPGNCTPANIVSQEHPMAIFSRGRPGLIYLTASETRETVRTISAKNAETAFFFRNAHPSPNVRLRNITVEKIKKTGSSILSEERLVSGNPGCK